MSTVIPHSGPVYNTVWPECHRFFTDKTTDPPHVQNVNMDHFTVETAHRRVVHGWPDGGYGGGDHGGWVPLRLCPVAVHPWVHHAGPTPAAMPVTPPACTRPCPRSAHVRGNCVHRHPSLANRAMCDLSTAVTNGEHPTTNGAVRRRSGFPAGLTTSYSSAWTFRVRASSTHASVQRPSISHCTAPLGLFRGHYTTLLIRKER